MRLLITGGAGFIGSQYVRTVLTGGYPAFAGARVTVLDRLTYAGNLANLAPVEGVTTSSTGTSATRTCSARWFPVTT